MTIRTGTADALLGLEPAPAPERRPGHVVVHPLNAAPEAKVDLDRLGPMRLSRGRRAALVALRCYLAGIMLAGAWRVVELARHGH